MTVHDFTMTTIDGTQKPLSDYAGKVVMVKSCTVLRFKSNLIEFFPDEEQAP